MTRGYVCWCFVFVLLVCVLCFINMDLCKVCCKELRSRQQVVSCSTCQKRQHRTCGTGISQTSYRQQQKAGRDVLFVCSACNEEEVTFMDDEEVVLAVHDSDLAERSIADFNSPVRIPMAESTIHDPVGESSAHFTMDESAIHDPMEESAIHDPFEESTVHDPREESAIHDPFEEPTVHDPMEESAIHDPFEESTVHDPREESAIHDPFEESTVHDPMEESAIHDPFEESTVHDPLEDSAIHDPLEESAMDVVQDDQPLDDSFDISHRRVDDREPVHEESLADRTLTDTVLEVEPLRYTVIENGTQRGTDLLVTTTGYTYGVKNRNAAGTRTKWRCTIRTKAINCHATVSQRGEEFTAGVVEHSHGPQEGRELKAKITKQAKAAAKEMVFRPAMTIVEDALLEHVTDDDFVIPKSKLVKRVTNRARAKLRPKEPRTLDFEVDDDFLQLGDFLVADVKVDNQRHFLFATPQQLGLLKRAKRWYMDGTFKVLDDPFKATGQLMSIHAFVTRDGETKQFPLAFCLMSRKTVPDYVKVLTELKTKMGEVSVQEFVVDFEKAAWIAIRRVFVDLPIKGCIFHWTQAIWRKVQDQGLATTYRLREAAHGYLRKLMALPFLPAAHIRPTFDLLRNKANTDPLKEVTSYINRQWIESSVFDIPSWSVFRQTVRTNNDVEGWHHRLNRKAGMAGLGFYRLVPLLRREAELVELAVRGGDLCRDRRNAATRLDNQLTQLWDVYMADELTTARLLRRCGDLYRVR